MNRSGEGDRVWIDIPYETDPDHEPYHGRSLTSYGQWVSQTRGRWAEWHCLENGIADLIDDLAAKVTCAHSGD